MWTENLFCILLFALCLENVMTSSITPTPTSSTSNVHATATTTSPIRHHSFYVLNSTKAATKLRRTSISVSTQPSSTPSISETTGAPDSSLTAVPDGSPSATLNGNTVATTISPSKSTPIPQPSSSAKPAPKVSLQKCSMSENDCKNDGECYSGRFKFCVCRGNFYGTKCEKEANALFRPLVYALGGTTGFLLLIICISLICMCRSSNRYKTSKEIDDFNSIGMRAKGTVNGSYGD